MHYYASSLRDGTVMAAFPIRKPSRKVMKRDHLRVDAEGICDESLRSGQELRNANYEDRFRFQDILSISLNTRRAVREIALPELATLQQEVATIRLQLDRIEQLLGERRQT
jgi:hypothetical protein